MSAKRSAANGDRSGLYLDLAGEAAIESDRDGLSIQRRRHQTCIERLIKCTYNDYFADFSDGDEIKEEHDRKLDARRVEEEEDDGKDGKE